MSSLSKSHLSASKIYLAYPAYPGVNELYELGLAYDRVFDGGGMLEETIKGARSFAKFLEDGSVDDIKDWYFEGLGVLFLDRSLLGLKSLGVRERQIASIFSDIEIIDRLNSARRDDRGVFRHIIGSIANELRTTYPHVLRDVTEFIDDLPLLRDSFIEYFSPQSIRATHGAVEKYVFDAFDLDEKDTQFTKLARRADKGNPPQWTSFVLNSSLMESSYMQMDLFLPENFLPMLEYKLLRGGASLDKSRRRGQVLQQSVSTLLPDLKDLNIPDYLEIRNSRHAKSFRRELARIIASGAQTEKNASEYITQNYVRQLEDLAEARRPNLRYWSLKTFLSLVNPLAGFFIAGMDGYKEIKDQFSGWNLALTTLAIRKKVESRKSVSTV